MGWTEIWIAVVFIAALIVDQVWHPSQEPRLLFGMFWLASIIAIATESCRRQRREKLRKLQEKLRDHTQSGPIDYVASDYATLTEVVADDEDVAVSMRVNLILIGIFFVILAALNGIFFHPSRKGWLGFGWGCLILLLITVMEPFYEGWGRRRKRTESKLNTVLDELKKVASTRTRLDTRSFEMNIQMTKLDIIAEKLERIEHGMQTREELSRIAKRLETIQDRLEQIGEPWPVSTPLRAYPLPADVATKTDITLAVTAARQEVGATLSHKWAW